MRMMSTMLIREMMKMRVLVIIIMTTMIFCGV